MPIKWTAENDQLLLLKILETCNVTVDAKAVAEAWPCNENADVPTARAVTERIVKIRALARASDLAGHFRISSSQTKSSPPKKAPAGSNSTAPRKPRAKHDPDGGSSAPVTPGKRKRAGDEGVVVKTENQADADEGGYGMPDGVLWSGRGNRNVGADESPSKRTKALKVEMMGAVHELVDGIGDYGDIYGTAEYC